MANIFRFKQFSVDQTGCAMKINTDGVLLGASAIADNPKSILDIGTGTGVIALMLAQRFKNGIVDAVEIDEAAAETAAQNFSNSPFASRLALHPVGFEQYFAAYPDKKYDLIVSNPPFYINSLQSPGEKINLAKHARDGFFEGLMVTIYSSLTLNGTCWLILPTDTAVLVITLATNQGLHLQKLINVYSFDDSEPHRQLLAFGLQPCMLQNEKFVIYEYLKVYSKEYREMLKSFLTIF